jgi:hypothetical protein
MKFSVLQQVVYFVTAGTKYVRIPLINEMIIFCCFQNNDIQTKERIILQHLQKCTKAAHIPYTGGVGAL